MNAEKSTTVETAEAKPDCAPSGLLGTVNQYAVAVATKITLEGKHWFSDDQNWTGMNLYFINAPDKEIAEALGVQKALKHRREETPGAEVSIQATTAKEVPNE